MKEAPILRGPFPGVLDHEREVIAGDVIRKAVEHDHEKMRFYLTCSVGELAQRVVVALAAVQTPQTAATEAAPVGRKGKR